MFCPGPAPSQGDQPLPRVSKDALQTPVLLPAVHAEAGESWLQQAA